MMMSSMYWELSIGVVVHLSYMVSHARNNMYIQNDKNEDLTQMLSKDIV